MRNHLIVFIICLLFLLGDWGGLGIGTGMPGNDEDIELFDGIKAEQVFALDETTTEPAGNESANAEKKEEKVNEGISISKNELLAQNDWKWQYKAEGKYVLKTNCLPDDRNTSCAVEDRQSENSYYISALDTELTIPDGMYLYHIPGAYLEENTKRDGTVITLEFVDEYVLVEKEYEDMEKLVKHIALYSDPDWLETEYATPSWVLWDFKIFHKDYLPVEQLFESRVLMSNEYRLKGDYLVHIGTLRWDRYHDEGVESVMRTVLDATEGSGVEYLYWEIVNGDHGHNQLFYNLPTNMGSWSKSPHLSLMSNLWWQTYQYAMKELEKDPAGNTWSNGTLSLRGVEKENWYGEPDEWVQNSDESIRLRAFVYVLLVMAGENPELKDIVVFTRQSENVCLLYLAFWGPEWKLVCHGLDYTGLCDFEFARSYVEKYMMRGF